MAAKKRDQLSAVGVASAIAKNVAQQRSLAKARERKSAPPVVKVKVKAPKDTRTAAEIAAGVALTRARLVTTVSQIKYDLDVPARARDLRDRVANRFPQSWRGEVPALVAASSVALVGVATLLGAVRATMRVRG